MFSKIKFINCNWLIFLVAFALVCPFLLFNEKELNAQFGKTFIILLKINGEEDAINDVSVKLQSQGLFVPVTRLTIPNGWTLFPMLKSGNYSITPEKEGYFFTPSTLTITLGDESEMITLVTFQSTKGQSPDDKFVIPFEDEWASSAHADATSEAFNHWNEDGEIPASCAKCHSTPGLRDFLGDDGTAPQTVDNPAPTGTVITCEVCHNDKAVALDNVTFPSGETVADLGHEAICMTCHQGRSSTIDVNTSIEEAEVNDDDAVNENLNFINIHYYAAAATLYGTFAKGGYQYDGKSYDGRLAHAEGVNVCVDCHNPHTLKIKLELCSTCHKNVTEQEDIFDIRMNGSLVDYDGDGNMTEGIFFEIETLREKLLDAIQAYAIIKTGVPIVYEEHVYPYFFIDTNSNGKTDPVESAFGNRFNAWSARLLKAAFNYQVSLKDPGAFAHGGKYTIELLFDSIEDVNSVLNAPIAMAGTFRIDEGHFDGSKEAFRHWDEDGEVPGSCARCHGAGGFATFLENDTNIVAPVANGMLCSTCHNDLTDFSSRRNVDTVTFPSGWTATLEDDSNMCMICHQGRSSKFSVDDAIESSPGPYSFINIHYYPVAAILFGTDVQGGYEFAGKEYVGQNTFSEHLGIFDTCVACHMDRVEYQVDVKGVDYNKAHNVAAPNPAYCVICHGNDVSQSNPGDDANLFEFKEIRPDGFPDYDGDGNVNESLWSEIKGLEETLLTTMQTYATESGNPIVYEPHTYPYYFNDTDGNGDVDVGEAGFPNRYVSFDANLLKAAYNYQTSLKEPCGYIHNGKYIAQLLVDSIEVLGGDVSTFTWR